MAERQDGRDGMAVAVYLRRLARLKFEQGDNAAAESLLQRVLTIQEKNLSPRSPDRISTLEWLAHLSQTKGDLDGALNLTRQILGIRAAAYGEDDLGAANTPITVLAFYSGRNATMNLRRRHSFAHWKSVKNIATEMKNFWL